MARARGVMLLGAVRRATPRGHGAPEASHAAHTARTALRQTDALVLPLTSRPRETTHETRRYRRIVWRRRRFTFDGRLLFVTCLVACNQPTRFHSTLSGERLGSAPRSRSTGAHTRRARTQSFRLQLAGPRSGMRLVTEDELAKSAAAAALRRSTCVTWQNMSFSQLGTRRVHNRMTRTEG